MSKRAMSAINRAHSISSNREIAHSGFVNIRVIESLIHVMSEATFELIALQIGAYSRGIGPLSGLHPNRTSSERLPAVRFEAERVAAAQDLAGLRLVRVQIQCM